MSYTIVWLVEREFICPKRFVPVAISPSATRKDALMKRDSLPRPAMYVVTKYKRVEEGKNDPAE